MLRILQVNNIMMVRIVTFINHNFNHHIKSHFFNHHIHLQGVTYTLKVQKTAVCHFLYAYVVTVMQMRLVL